MDEVYLIKSVNKTVNKNHQTAGQGHKFYLAFSKIFHL